MPQKSPPPLCLKALDKGLKAPHPKSQKKSQRAKTLKRADNTKLLTRQKYMPKRGKIFLLLWRFALHSLFYRSVSVGKLVWLVVVKHIAINFGIRVAKVIKRAFLRLWRQYKVPCSVKATPTHFPITKKIGF